MPIGFISLGLLYLHAMYIGVVQQIAMPFHI